MEGGGTRAYICGSVTLCSVEYVQKVFWLSNMVYAYGLWLEVVFVVYFVEIFMCGVGISECSAWKGVWCVQGTILMHAKEVFFPFPCAFQVGVASNGRGTCVMIW